MTCATPRSEHTSRRHYGCPFSRTPRADDGRLVPAGLLACGSNASLPPSRPDVPGQWHLGRCSPLTVAGAAAAWRETLSTRVPFSPAATRLGLRRDRHAAAAKQATPVLVNRLITSAYRLCACDVRTVTHVHPSDGGTIAAAAADPECDLDEILAAGSAERMARGTFATGARRRMGAVMFRIAVFACVALGALLISAPGALAQELVVCAQEQGFCSVPYPTEVIYGVPGRSASRYVSDRGIRCSNEVFGDPAPGAEKACAYVARGGWERRKTRRPRRR